MSPKKKNVYTDVISEGFSKYLYSLHIRSSGRDRIIADILDHDKMQQEYIKRLILEDSRVDVLMRLLGYRVAPHHMAFIKFFRGLRERDVRSGLVLGPRGCGKSTCNNISYSVLKALQDRNINILEASRTTDQAKAFLSAIKDNLIKPQITEMFGETKGEVWEKMSASVKGRDSGDKEQTFHVAGADGAIVSKHFDIINLDDLVDEKNSQSDTERFKVRKFYYKSLLPCLRPGGEIWANGTRYHPDDIYGDFLKTDPKFCKSYFILPAVFNKETGERVELEQDKNGKFFIPDGATVWDAEGYPEKDVLERRQSMPQGDFAAQYENRIEYLSGEYFKTTQFKYYKEDPFEVVKKEGLRVYMAADLAISQKDTADEFALFVVGIKPKVVDIYALEYVSGRFTFNQQKEMIVEYFDRWNPVRTYVEANAYQAALESTVFEEFPDVRTTPVYTSADKVSRGHSLSLYYERGQVYHRMNRMAKFEGQLTGFPHLKLKDLFDSFYIAVWGALKSIGRSRAKRTRRVGVIG